jgi:hypothetical protein
MSTVPKSHGLHSEALPLDKAAPGHGAAFVTWRTGNSLSDGKSEAEIPADEANRKNDISFEPPLPKKRHTSIAEAGQ